MQNPSDTQTVWSCRVALQLLVDNDIDCNSCIWLFLSAGAAAAEKLIEIGGQLIDEQLAHMKAAGENARSFLHDKVCLRLNAFLNILLAEYRYTPLLV